MMKMPDLVVPDSVTNLVPTYVKICLTYYHLKDIIPDVNRYLIYLSTPEFIQKELEKIVSSHLDPDTFNVPKIVERLYERYKESYGIHFSDFLALWSDALKIEWSNAKEYRESREYILETISDKTSKDFKNLSEDILVEVMGRFPNIYDVLKVNKCIMIDARRDESCSEIFEVVKRIGQLEGYYQGTKDDNFYTFIFDHVSKSKST